MLFISIQFMLAILTGIFQTNQAFQLIPVVDDANITAPYIVDKNCTHVTYGFGIQYLALPVNFQINYAILSETITADIGTTSFLGGHFFNFHEPYRRYYNYTSVRVDPIPETWRDKHNLYVTFRFPDERREFRLGLGNILHPPWKYIESPTKSGKSRCFPQDDIAGCDPYCVCNTVVIKKCPDGSSIKGKCLDFESLTDNLANYTFNETCESSSQAKLSSIPSSSGSFSSIPSSSVSFSSILSSSTESPRKSFAASQSLELFIGIVVGMIFALGIILVMNFFRNKKKGFHSSLADGSEAKLYKSLNSTI